MDRERDREREWERERERERDSSQRDKDTRASSLLNLLNQQQEPGIYPISTPQPYPPSSSVPSTTLADHSSSSNPDGPTPTTRSTISVDSLFRNIGPTYQNEPESPSEPPSQQQQQQQQGYYSHYPGGYQNTPAENHPSPPSSMAHIQTERQTALLSLLGNVASPPLSEVSAGPPPPSEPHQQPQWSENSQNQSRNALLDTLLPGHAQQQNQQQQQQPNFQPSQAPPVVPASSSPSVHDYRPSSGSPSHTQAHPSIAPPGRYPTPPPLPSNSNATNVSSIAAEDVLDPTSSNASGVPRKSRFDYYSPFDALSASASTSGQHQVGGQQQQSPPQPQDFAQQQPPQTSNLASSTGSITRKKPVPPVDPLPPSTSPGHLSSSDYMYSTPPTYASNITPSQGPAPLSSSPSQPSYPQQSPQQPMSQIQGQGQPSISSQQPLSSIPQGQRPTSPRIHELQQQAAMMNFPRYSPSHSQSPDSVHHLGGRSGSMDAAAVQGTASRGQSDIEAQPVNTRMSPMHTQHYPAHQSPSLEPVIVQQLSTPESKREDQQAQAGSTRRREDLRPTGASNKASVSARGDREREGQAQQQQQQQQQPQQAAPKPLRGSPVVDHAAPTYNLDMESVHYPIRAAEGLSAVTPIALLRLENVYSPGTTIAVSSFIAYAMTRGRVRLIARSNGSRSLLHLPSSFGNSVSATDMVVQGNYLACVTSDGGLVIWNVPHELDDGPNVPVVLHVAPPASGDAAYALKLVKWHPKQIAGGTSGGGFASGGTLSNTGGTIAVASDREVYVFNVADAFERFGGEEVSLGDLASVSSLITVHSPLVGFTFDHPQLALATLSIDSTIMLWSIKDRLPFWTGRVPGEGLPSSIDFLEGGVLVGRKQGTILQLLPVMSAKVAATVKLSTPPKSKDSDQPDEDGIFAHVGYDPRLKTIWAAHSTRPSLYAIRISFEFNAPAASTTNGTTIPVIEQIIEFPIPMQCINMAILALPSSYGEGSISGQEGQTPLHELHPNYGMDAGIVPLTPVDSISGGSAYETAVATFAMHSGGVDQINISMNTFEEAIASVQAKLPPATYGVDSTQQVTTTIQKKTGATNQSQSVGSGRWASNAPTLANPELPRPRSPVSDVETAPVAPVTMNLGPPPVSVVAAEMATPVKGAKSAKDNGKGSTRGLPTAGKEKEKEKVGVNAPSSKENTSTPEAAASTSAKVEKIDYITAAILAKDLRKVEDNIHSKVGKLLSKELDRQHQRIEELRRADQEADFARQEMILKLISTELTKNTTRVVEQAIKSEVQNTVLPSLEAITKNEIKAALGNQVSKGIADTLKTALPNELERLLMRPDVSAHIARGFTQNVSPIIERHVRDAISKNLVPAFQQTSQNMHMELARDVSAEIINLKKEIVTWQSDAIRSTEATVRDMEQSLRSLSEQVRNLQLQLQTQQSTSHVSSSHRNSPGAGTIQQPVQSSASTLQQPHPHHHASSSSQLRQGNFNSSRDLPSLLQQLPPQPTQQQQQPVLQQPQPTSWQQVPGLAQPPQLPPQPQQQYQPSQQPPIGSYSQQSYKQQPQQQAPQPQQLKIQQPSQQQHQSQQAPNAAQLPRSFATVGAPAAEDWDDIFLATLQSHDPRQLRDLLARCNPEVVMPVKRELTPISQAVVLTLIHRLSESLPDLSPNDEAMRAALWWLQRSAYTLNPSDPMVETYVDPVLNTSHTILGTTANRLVGYPELQNTISQIQHTLSIQS